MDSLSLSLDKNRFKVVTNSAGFPVIVPISDNSISFKSSVSAATSIAEASAPSTESTTLAAGREKTRLTKESGERIHQGGPTSANLGGSFQRKENPEFLKQRADVYDEVISAQNARLANKPRLPISITLPDGKVINGTSWETTPMQIAEGISKSLAGNCVVAKVAYLTRHGVEEADGLSAANTGPEEEEDGAANPAAKAELWDLLRPLEGDCTLELKKFDDKEGKMVFWHSSAHILGECLECKFGAKLCIGPPTEEGFYYDAFMGEHGISEHEFPLIKSKGEEIVKAKQPFERIVLTKSQALRLFADNPFKVQLISTKIPDGGYTTAYRCGPLIDLCRGPHVPTTASVKAFEVLRSSACYWLGNVENDSLQRVYGISFPDTKLLKAHLLMLEEAKKRDHRLIGMKQELFFFHELSPGSCFFLPHGARIYNKLMEHIKVGYRERGFNEVVTPNMYNIDLWRISGHADHYLDNMFTFKVEGQDFALKPMNCPGHCLMFDNRVRSYRELPIRMADFGVLHRNEFSGALTGLTRVRRFQQDDAHIFCRTDQITDEVNGALDFVNHVYGVFGFNFELDLSTRPKKALGSLELWTKAEAMMTDALNRFGKPWKINPGDGAFYGPKIDIKVFDALGRRHQCATIQLDFQLPIRFNLRYKARGDTDAAGGEGGEEGGAAASSSATTSEESAGGMHASEEHAASSASNAHGKGGKKGKKEKGSNNDKDATSSAADSHGHKHSHDGHKHHPHEEHKIISPVQAAVDRARSGIDELPEGFERPVIIHRAILGSVERFFAVLIEHTAGKWPLWISPRQVAIVPVALKYLDYCNTVCMALRREGFHAEVDSTHHTLNKKVREAQVAQYNFIFVLGQQEEEAGSVNIRTRDNAVHGTKPLSEALTMLKQLVESHQ
jgi:threonyl-tRNA synthetase